MLTLCLAPVNNVVLLNLSHFTFTWSGLSLGRRHYKTGLLKIGRIWRNHVAQVWTISYSAVCRSSSCFEQQVAIFPVDGALLYARSVWVSFKRTYVLSLQKVEKLPGYGIL